MAIQLSNFEQQIDPTILKRGYEYFKNGYVTDVEDLGHGDYEATVEGSDTYTVSLHIEGDEVTDYECDCPYDWGPVCKHVAAVLFYLQKDLLETDIPLQKEKRNKPKKESEAAQFEKLLKQLTHEELKTFICDVCTKDKSLRRLFIAKHLSRLYPVSKELYDKQVKKLVETYADQYGFIDYQESSQLSNAVNEMIEEARRCVKTGEKDKALYMSEAIIEGMYKTIDNADDSDGEIGGCLEEAFDVLSELSKKDMDESLHNEMSGWLLRHYEAGSMKGWDWHADLMRIAIGMVKTEEEKKRIQTILEQVRPNGKDWDWNYQTALDLRLQLIRQTEDEATALRFMETHVDNPDFRKELIEHALHEKDYDKAEGLAHEGVRKDDKDAPGLAEDWRNYLLQVYQATHHTEKIISLARHFFVDGSGRHHPNDYYYKLLKSLIPQTQWQRYVEGLIADINGKSRRDEPYNRVAQIYIWEKEWEKLFKLLRKSPSFYRIEEAEKYLATDHAEELATMYRHLIVDYLPDHIGRDHYQTVCKYIRRMAKLGHKPMALELIELLRTQYRNRRALQEELARVFQ